MEIIKDFNNKLLKRRELVVNLQTDKVPSNVEAQEAISVGQKKDKELVVVKSIRNSFGTREFEIEAFVYENIEQKGKLEMKPKVKKVAG